MLAREHFGEQAEKRCYLLWALSWVFIDLFMPFLTPVIMDGKNWQWNKNKEALSDKEFRNFGINSTEDIVIFNIISPKF